MAVQKRNGKKKLIILRLKCYKRQQKTKNNIFFAFFFKKICIYQKKTIPLHQINKKHYKQLKKTIMYYIISPDFDECITYVHKDAFIKNSKRTLTFIKDYAICHTDKEKAYYLMNEYKKQHNIIGCHLYVVFM